MPPQSILLRILPEATPLCAVFSREDTSLQRQSLCTVGRYWPNLLLKLAGAFRLKRRDAKEELALWRKTGFDLNSCIPFGFAF